MKAENEVVIEIDLTKKVSILLIVLLAGIVLLGGLAIFGDFSAAFAQDVSAVQAEGMRQFYLTEDTFDGKGAPNACAAGYHFASIWELADPSNLIYNTSLGFSLVDSGDGPPRVNGWVRTGGSARTSGNPGQVNCNAWQSRLNTHYGTVVSPVEIWDGTNQDVGFWYAHKYDCELSRYVWCVED